MAWIYYSGQGFLDLSQISAHNDKDKSFKNTNEEAEEMKTLLLSTNE